MLKSDALKFPDEDGVLILEEESDHQVKLIEAPPDLVAVDIRKFGKIANFTLFKENGWKQSCDYLLAFQENGNDRALLVDLKKTLGNKGKSKGMSQLRWSRALYWIICGLSVKFCARRPPAVCRSLLITLSSAKKMIKIWIRILSSLSQEKHCGSLTRI